MEKKNILDPLPFKVDDFFTTQEQRDEAQKEKIEEIEIDFDKEMPPIMEKRMKTYSKVRHSNQKEVVAKEGVGFTHSDCAGLSAPGAGGNRYRRFEHL